MFLRTAAHLGGRREEIGILSFFGGPDAGVGAVGSSYPLKYCCFDFIEQEVGSVEVSHWVKDSVADTDSAKLHKPKQVTHPERGTHKMLWELRTGRAHCCSGVPGSFHREGGLGSWTTKDHFICTGDGAGSGSSRS